MNDPAATGIPGFHGRDEELAWLYGLFEESVRSRTPNFAVVVAESGLGKSRLVQALYQKLAADPEWDPGDFWPDAFGDDAGRSLLVNPAFDADHKPKAPPKFLWLGMRWEDPQGRNRADVLCPLPNVKEQLSRCLDVTLKHAGGWGQAKEVVRRLVPFTWDQLSGMALDVLGEHAEILEYAGVLVPGTGAVAKAVKGVIGLPDTMAGAEGKAQRRAGDQLLEYLQGLMRSGDPVPTVLWLDDAQWIDEATAAFLRTLLYEAKPRPREQRRGWPLLLVATCWEREWNEASRDGSKAGKGLALFENKPLGGGRRMQVRVLGKSRKEPLGGLLKELLPGLTEGQRALLLEKADGNFLTMTENIGYLDNARNFEDGNPGGRLTDAAVKKVEKWESDRERHVEQRFNELGEEHQKVLGWGAGSPLGSRFVEEVVVRVAEAEGGVGKPRERLAECAVASAVLTGGGAGSPPRPLREFRDRAYFLAANKFFDEYLRDGREVLDEPVREVLSEWVDACFGADGEWDGGRGESPLGLVSATERVDVLEAACEALPFDVDGDWSDGFSAAGLRAACLLVRECARAGLWDRCRMAGEALEGVGWGAVPVKVLRQGFRGELMPVLHQAHAFKSAHGVAKHIAERCRADAEEVGSPESRSDLADSLNGLGVVQHGRGDLEGAAESLREALGILRALAEEVGGPESRTALAVSLNNLGVVQGRHGDLEGAAESHQEALRIRRALADEVGGPESRARLANSLHNLGAVQRRRGDLDGAAERHREALRIRRALADEVGGPESRSDLALSLNDLGFVQQSRGDLDGAAESLRDAVEIRRALADEVGGPAFRELLAALLNNLGVVQVSRGDLEGAAESLRDAVEIRRALADEVGVPESRAGLAQSLSNLGVVQRRRGDLEGAAESFRESLRIWRALADEVGGPESRSHLAASLNNLGNVQRSRGDLEGAAETWREALGIRQALADESGEPVHLQAVTQLKAGLEGLKKSHEGG